MTGGITLFLCGDVMTGRGLDQILPHPGDPRLHEPALTSALDYVALAERAHGPVPRRVNGRYVWGAALPLLDSVRPHARIINLETSITTSDAALPKGINYRMHPANIGVLRDAGIDCCVLANNHVLDWGEAGLADTLEALARAGIATAGAGTDSDRARRHATLRSDGARILVFAFCTGDSGVPPDWSATAGRAGVNRIDISDDAAAAIGRTVQSVKRTGDIAIASIHWGGNWGYDVPDRHRTFARALIDRAGIDVVHGHSSHHPKAIEIYRDRPIFYGCGDLLNDYEGIAGHDEYRTDLVLLYFPALDPRTGRLTQLTMAPLRIRRFRLGPMPAADLEWLRATMDRECAMFGHGVRRRGDSLVLEWR